MRNRRGVEKGSFSSGKSETIRSMGERIRAIKICRGLWDSAFRQVRMVRLERILRRDFRIASTYRLPLFIYIRFSGRGWSRGRLDCAVVHTLMQSVL